MIQSTDISLNNDIINEPNEIEPDKLTKEEFVEMCIGIGEILSEASIHQNKYPPGHKVMWSKSGESQFSKKLPEGEPMMTMPAVKTNSTEDAIKVFQKDSGAEFYLKGKNMNIPMNLFKKNEYTHPGNIIDDIDLKELKGTKIMAGHFLLTEPIFQILINIEIILITILWNPYITGGLSAVLLLK